MMEMEKMKRREEGYFVASDKKVDVEFVYLAPQAKKVCLAGSFNNWDTSSLPMKKNKKGQWTTTVKLVPGRYEYKYYADGSWVKDMQCSEVVMNDMGTTNCVISVAPKRAA